MDDVTLLQDPIVLAALAFWAARDGRADAQARMAAAYDALVAANMWPKKFAGYAGATDAVKLKTWKQAGVLKSLPKPNAAIQAAAEDLYTRLYNPQPEPDSEPAPPPVQGGFEDSLPPLEKAKALALLAQLAAGGGAPDALQRGFAAAAAIYVADAWDLAQHASYLAKTDDIKLKLWASGSIYKSLWGFPPPGDLQLAIDQYRQIYAKELADGTMSDPLIINGGNGKPKPAPSSGGLGIGTLVLGGLGLWGLSKILGGR